MWPRGPALEFRVVLHPYVEGVALYLDGLRKAAVGGGAGDYQPGLCERPPELVIELVAVAVAFAYARRAVAPGELRAGLYDAGPRPEAQRPALLPAPIPAL